MQSIQFRATIPAIQSAIRTGSDGLRLQLDVPETDVSDAVAMIALRGKGLKITVEVDESE